MYQSAMRWLAVWLDLLVVAITFIVALFIVLLTGSIAPTDAGMALVFALQVVFQCFAKFFSSWSNEPHGIIVK